MTPNHISISAVGDGSRWYCILSGPSDNPEFIHLCQAAEGLTPEEAWREAELSEPYYSGLMPKVEPIKTLAEIMLDALKPNPLANIPKFTLKF